MYILICALIGFSLPNTTAPAINPAIIVFDGQSVYLIYLIMHLSVLNNPTKNPKFCECVNVALYTVNSLSLNL